jgi:dihydrofolate synthase/folylpolyglutamate synthase
VKLDDALAYLDRHVNLEVLPPGAPGVARSLERMRRLVSVLGDPQSAYPVIHVTGTNGKGSVSRMVSALCAEMGLSVGTYTSPHLERLNERICWNGEPIGDAALCEMVEAVAMVEPMLGGVPTYFEILTAAAFRYFADVAVDVAVVEVGLGGRWDATNVADGTVAVVTNVAIDHTDYLGPTRAHIAAQKAGIVKPGATLVLGEDDPELVPLFLAERPALAWLRGADFACTGNRLAHGGRLCDLRTPGAAYHEVYVPLHGAHQGDNAAVALAAAEAFFGRPLDQDVVEAAFAAVEVPGRMEVLRRRPLVVVDGAHNPAGAAALGSACDEAFGTEAGRILVVGMLKGRDPVELLAALGAGRAKRLFACAPDSPRAMPADEVAAAARAVGAPAEVTGSVAEALARALAAAGPDDQVVVTGSLYVVGAARGLLRAGEHAGRPLARGSPG